MKSLDNERAQVHCGRMDADLSTSVIPKGCGSLWYADAPGIDPAATVTTAAAKAAKSGIAQAVRMPGGRIVIIHPETAVNTAA